MRTRQRALLLIFVMVTAAGGVGATAMVVLLVLAGTGLFVQIGGPVVRRLKEDEHGPGAVAFYGTANLTEEYHLMKKLMKAAIGTNKCRAQHAGEWVRAETQVTGNRKLRNSQ